MAMLKFVKHLKAAKETTIRMLEQVSSPAPPTIHFQEIENGWGE